MSGYIYEYVSFFYKVLFFIICLHAVWLVTFQLPQAFLHILLKSA